MDILTTVNPSIHGVFEGYKAQDRAVCPLGANITTYAKTHSLPDNNLVTIYRGVPASVKSINAGDFVTDLMQLAKDYSPDLVLKMQVRACDILDDLDEPCGNEYIYRPTQATTTTTTPQQLAALKQLAHCQGKNIYVHYRESNTHCFVYAGGGLVLKGDKKHPNHYYNSKGGVNITKHIAVALGVKYDEIKGIDCTRYHSGTGVSSMGEVLLSAVNKLSLTHQVSQKPIFTKDTVWHLDARSRLM